MTNNLKRPLLRAALFFTGIAVIASSCKKPEEEIGLELQPGGDLLQANVVDTFTVKAYTLIDDSVRTDVLNPAVIGAYNDPVFGFTKAGHITQLRLSSTNPILIPTDSNIDNIEVDSVILVLDYAKIVSDGDTLSPIYGGNGSQYFEVFELLDSLSVDSVYYEYTDVNYINIDLVKSGFNMQTPNITDSVLAGTTMLGPQMRIPLNEGFVDRFLNASGSLDDSKFATLLKGIYITVDETQFNTSNSGLISFDTFTGDSRITMYYRNVLPDTTESFQYSFSIRSNSAKFESFEHDYNLATPSLSQQISGDFTSGGQDLYIQGVGGAKIFVDLPFIENLRDSSGIAINQAKLSLPVRGGDLDAFAPPFQMLIFPLNEDGDIYPLLYDDPASYGKYNADKGVYEFIITRYLQQVLLGSREHYGFEIVSLSSSAFPNRVILNGSEYPDPQNPSNNLKLAVTFTKF